jgi:hypothetical protein
LGVCSDALGLVGRIHLHYECFAVGPRERRTLVQEQSKPGWKGDIRSEPEKRSAPTSGPSNSRLRAFRTGVPPCRLRSARTNRGAATARPYSPSTG